MHVTQRASLGVDYLFEPLSSGSVEVLAAPGQSITSNEFGKADDRIMIIDCDGQCGVSEPAVDVQTTTATDSMVDRLKMWSEFEPLHSAGYVMNYNVTRDNYVLYENKYCPAQNLDVFNSTKFPYHSTHQCWSKCHAGAGCTGANCYCDGYWQNVHGPNTPVLCLSRDLCMEACSAMPECTSIDMHRNLPRCYLNFDDVCGKDLHEEMMTKDAEYDLLLKQTALLDTGGQASGLGPVARTVIEGPRYDKSAFTEDRGYSFDSVLRYAPIFLGQGGRYKVCLCDYDAHGKCNEVHDFPYELGMIHNSGVSCLLKDSILLQGSCTPSYHGGQRCSHQFTVPEVGKPSRTQGALLAPASRVQNLGTHYTATLMCEFGPMDQTSQLEVCNAIYSSGFKSANLDAAHGFVNSFHNMPLSEQFR